MSFKNLAEIIPGNADRLGDRTAYQYKKDGSYQSISFNEARDWVNKIAGGLAALGVAAGEKVALLSENRFEWAFADYAILTVRAINVPIYPSLIPHQVEYLIKDSESKVIICSDAKQLEKIEKVRSNCPTLEHVIVIDHDDSMKHCSSLSELMQKGAEYNDKNPDYISSEIAKIKPDDLITIIYTSGTTGEPKGVMLTHNNLISNIEGGLAALDVDENDVFLSFLPLCHVFERMVGHFLAAYISATIAYAESIDTVADNMGEIHPSVMASVPRLYEKIYARVLENVESGPGLKRKIFYWAIEVGREYVNKQMNHETVGSGLQFKRNLAYKLVFSKLAERVGGNLKFFASGGAPLSKEIGEFFAAAGLFIFEGYGLTETSPIITVNRPEKFRFGSVGQKLFNVEVKIAEDGEILTRGPHVMVGYFKKEADTKEVIDEDGWFYTGDIGHLDEDGMLTITDRKKNILVTSGGKNIAPQGIEGKLVTCKYIEQAMIIGDRRRYCTAVIVPAFEALEKVATEKGWTYEGNEGLAGLAEVRELIQKDVEGVNDNLSSFETVKDFVLAKQPFSIESGELTPSLKVKRKVVIEKFADEIENMYQV
jgi:long-chain acyl-CoA synthetase